MKMVCPEHREVYVETCWGLLLYRHRDDQSKCHFLNRFHITPTDTLKQFIVGDSFRQNHSTLACLLASDEVLFQLCEELQQASDMRQAEMLRVLYRFCESQGDFWICEQLFKQFGPVFQINMFTATGRDFFDGNYLIDERNPPRYQLRRLGPEYGPVGSAAECLSEALEENKRSAISMFNSLSQKKGRRSM